MKINKILKKKALPSFCTGNMDVLNSIMFFCHLKKLPCLIECTSNQVNQNGGYTKKTPKKFIEEINKLRKKTKLNKNQLFLGGDHLGPLPWKNKKKKIALKNSVNLIESFLKEKFCKIHIDTSIKCKDDDIFNNEIIFQRTKDILKHSRIKKKLKGKFLIIGSEVPLSGSGDNKRIILTNIKQIKNESLKFKKTLKGLNLRISRKFGLVVEPGMKYMHSSIKKPNLKKFTDKAKFSKKNNFVFEAHSTDYQPLNILRKLTKNNFKFLKVGPELTYSYSRSIFYMQNLESKFDFKIKSNIKSRVFNIMKNNKKHWKNYYSNKKSKLLLNSKLDRMRYYLNFRSVENSIKILKKNINKIQKKEIFKVLGNNIKMDFINYQNKSLTNFETLKLIFISKSLEKYYSACGFRVS